MYGVLPLFLQLVAEKTLFHSRIENGLYHFRSSLLTSSHQYKLAKALFFSRRVNSDIWHHHLKYPLFNIQQAVLFNFSPSIKRTKTACFSCQHVKRTKLPFSLSSSRSLAPLALIHCNVWALSLVSSASGFKYYDFFIDDCSCYYWIYPLLLKSDVFRTFCTLKSYVENHFDSKIEIFRYDSGGEFIGAQFKQLLSCMGFYINSHAHTLKQNGVVERKHVTSFKPAFISWTTPLYLQFIGLNLSTRLLI